MRVAVIGYGAIGERVVEGLQEGIIPDANLVGVVVRDSIVPGTGRAAAAGYTDVPH